MDSRGRVTYGACNVYDQTTGDFHSATLKFTAQLTESCQLSIKKGDDEIGWGRAYFDQNGSMYLLGVMIGYGSIHLFK